MGAKGPLLNGAGVLLSPFVCCVAAVAQLVEPSVVVRVVVGSSPIGRPTFFSLLRKKTPNI